MNSPIGVVAIGRNEGARLVRCLTALRDGACAIVYVDSGSSDGSVQAARDLGVEVVDLDSTRPFTAARGRNAGFARLCELQPGLDRVQFVDGDCEIQPGWLAAASVCLDGDPQVAVVTGRRRERQPEASVYNRLADLEWDTPIGDATSFGGDVMVRAGVFEQVGGYDETLIAGEDPDLSFRIVAAGHRVVRLDEEMTLHDADMHHLGEFWRRQVRGGHAWAELLSLHGSEADARAYRAVRSIAFWAGLLPAASLTLAWSTSGASLGLLGLYAMLWLRIRRHETRDPARAPWATLYATACLIGKFAEGQGALIFAWTRLVRRRQSTLIEYKGLAPQPGPGGPGVASRPNARPLP